MPTLTIPTPVRRLIRRGLRYLGFRGHSLQTCSTPRNLRLVIRCSNGYPVRFALTNDSAAHLADVIRRHLARVADGEGK